VIAMAIGLALADIWQAAALLVFLVAFFNGMGWFARRYRPGRQP
jgi:hypothetical protein